MTVPYSYETLKKFSKEDLFVVYRNSIIDIINESLVKTDYSLINEPRDMIQSLKHALVDYAVGRKKDDTTYGRVLSLMNSNSLPDRTIAHFREYSRILISSCVQDICFAKEHHERLTRWGNYEETEYSNYF